MSRVRLRHRLEYAAFRLLSAVLRALPERLALGLGAALGRFAGGVLGIRRADVERNLRIAFPDATDAWRARVARESWAHLGREAVVTFRLAGTSAEEIRARVPIEGFELMERAMAEGRGAVMITGHLGNWEIGAAALAARGIGVDAVAKRMANLRFDADLVASRRALGIEIVDMSEAPRRMLRTLREGRVAGLVADQNAHRNGIFVPFFGVPAATARGPAVFALRTGAPVFFGCALARPGHPHRYRGRMVPVEFERTGDFEEDVRRLTVAWTAALEARVREAPEQYFWQHKRWKTRPPDEEPAPERAV